MRVVRPQPPGIGRAMLTFSLTREARKWPRPPFVNPTSSHSPGIDQGKPQRATRGSRRTFRLLSKTCARTPHASRSTRRGVRGKSRKVERGMSALMKQRERELALGMDQVDRHIRSANTFLLPLISIVLLLSPSSCWLSYLLFSPSSVLLNV